MRSLPPWNDKVGPTATQLRRRVLAMLNGQAKPTYPAMCEHGLYDWMCRRCNPRKDSDG